jgi:hypothetical protein
MTVWIDSDLYFYTVSGEIQVLREVRRYRAGFAVSSRRHSAAPSASAADQAVITTFGY